jgi:hypothetical protein
MKGFGRVVILWGLIRQFIPLTGLKLLLGWFEIWKARHNTMQVQGNNQNVVHSFTSHDEGV